MPRKIPTRHRMTPEQLEAKLNTPEQRKKHNGYGFNELLTFLHTPSMGAYQVGRVFGANGERIYAWAEILGIDIRRKGDTHG